MKNSIYLLFITIFFFNISLALADNDNLDSLKTVANVLKTGNTHVQKVSESTKIARHHYEIAKKEFMDALDTALKNPAHVSQISKIVSACFTSMAKVMQKEIGPVDLSIASCSKILPEASHRLIWNIAALTAASQTPAVKAATYYVGSKMINYCAGPKLFPEERETVSYREETALLKRYTKELQSLS